MPSGFMYRTVILDWSSRDVLAWRLSNTLDGTFCPEALEEGLARSFGFYCHARPHQGLGDRTPAEVDWAA